MAELVGLRYAHALFEAGVDLKKLSKFKDDLTNIVSVLKKEPRLKQILCHPKISKDEKKDLLSSLFKEEISKEMLNFLYILVDKRRMSHVNQMYKNFEKMFNEHENILEVTAITAIPMNKKTQEKLKIVLSKKMNKTIKLKNIVNIDVIGGVLLKIGNKVVDGSIRGQLQSVEKAMRGLVL